MKLSHPLNHKKQFAEEPISEHPVDHHKSKRSGKRKKAERNNHGPNFFLEHVKQENPVLTAELRFLCKKISFVFESWMSWQRKIFLCGLTERCMKPFLVTLATVVEPISHCSFQSKYSPLRIRKTSSKVATKEAEILEYDENLFTKKPHFPANRKFSTQRKSPVPLGLRRYTLGKVEPVSISATPGFDTAHMHKKVDSTSSGSATCFFPEIMTAKTKQLGKICSVKPAITSETDSKGYFNKSFKNRKWWATSSADKNLCSPKRNRLLEHFRAHLDMIYKVI